MKTSATTSPRFWNFIAKRYARQPIADEAAYQHKLEVTRTYLRPDMRVLEFGCGTGSTALVHAPRVAHIDAIDFSRKMIAIAEGKAMAQGIGNVTFRAATIEDWPASDHSYDAVLGLNILHLVADMDAVLGKVRRLLVPGGVFVSSTVCLGDTGGIIKRLLPIGHALGLLPLVQTLTDRDLTDRLTRAGFAIDHRWRPGPDRAVFVVAKAA